MTELTPRLVSMLLSERCGPRTLVDSHRLSPRGFALRLNGQGGGVYYLVATTRAGRRTWLRLGDVRTLTLDAARDVARVRAGELAKGGDPVHEAREARRAAREQATQERRDAKAPTVAALCRAYVDARAKRIATATEGNYREILARHISPSVLGRKRAALVSRGDVREFLARWHGRATGDQLLALLRAAYRWGQLEEIEPGVPLVERDPTRGVEPGPRRRRTRALSDAELRAWWPALDALGPVKAGYLRLLVLLGLRRGESHAARWRDIDLEAGTWTIPTERRKVRVTIRELVPALVVPLSPLAVEILAGLPRRGDRVFPVSVGTIGAEAKAATGLGDVMIHDLRRTCSVGLERIGAPPYVISLALGHSRVAGTSDADMHYVLSRRPAELRAWLTRWSQHVARVVRAEQADVLPFAPGG